MIEMSNVFVHFTINENIHGRKRISLQMKNKIGLRVLMNLFWHN